MAPLLIRMVGADVIERDLVAGMNVAPRDEKNVAVENFDVAVRLARVVDVVSPVAADTPVKTPVRINGADAQLAAAVCAARDLPARYFLARVLRDLVAFGKEGGGETSSPVNR